MIVCKTRNAGPDTAHRGTVGRHFTAKSRINAARPGPQDCNMRCGWVPERGVELDVHHGTDGDADHQL